MNQGIPPSKDLLAFRARAALLFVLGVSALVLFVWQFGIKDVSLSDEAIRRSLANEHNNDDGALQAARQVVARHLEFLGIRELSAWNTLAEDKRENESLFIGTVKGNTEWGTTQQYFFRVVLNLSAEGIWNESEFELHRNQ